MVIMTIQSLLAIKAADDEILIIDTKLTKREFGASGRFCDEPHLNAFLSHRCGGGLQSGALNLALGLITLAPVMWWWSIVIIRRCHSS